jgi:hypothetical protein
MATWDDVRRLALALPETSERGSRGLRQWRVRDKLFVWERPLRKRDGYPSILVELDRIALGDLEEVTTEAWLARAPAKLAQAYLAGR